MIAEEPAGIERSTKSTVCGLSAWPAQRLRKRMAGRKIRITQKRTSSLGMGCCVFLNLCRE